jgi:hypothetical protein
MKVCCLQVNDGTGEEYLAKQIKPGSKGQKLCIFPDMLKLDI